MRVVRNKCSDEDTDLRENSSALALVAIDLGSFAVETINGLGICNEFLATDAKTNISSSPHNRSEAPDVLVLDPA